MDDEGFNLFMKFAALLAAIVVAVFLGAYAIPVFPLWILIKGWDNTGVVVKTLAVIIPLLGLFTLITQNLGEGLSTVEMAWLIVAPFVNYGILYFAYAKRGQMFNV